jgi:hypothetical protein
MHRIFRLYICLHTLWSSLVYSTDSLYLYGTEETRNMMQTDFRASSEFPTHGPSVAEDESIIHSILMKISFN